MRYTTAFCVALCLGILGTSVVGEQPVSHYEQLKDLECLVGRWEYQGVDEAGRKVTGEETTEWMFDRTYLKSRGIYRREGLPALRYEAITGWDPVSQRVVMVLPTGDGGYLTRIGTVDPATIVWRSQEKSVDGEGHQATCVCTINFPDANTWTATWTDSVKDGARQPDSQITATRVLEDAGLPQDIVEEFEAMVGDWKVEGEGSMAPFHGSWHVTWAAGRQCLIYDFPLVVGDRPSHGTGLSAWDESTGERVWQASYQRGGIETARTKPVGNGVFRGPYSVVIDEKTYQGTIEQRRVSRDEWQLKMTGLASQGIRDASVRAVRVGSKPDGVATAAEDVATEHAALEQKYFDYWTPLAGTWKATIHQDGEDDLKVVFAYLPSDARPYYVGHGTLEDGTPAGDGVYGYDATHRCWRDVMFTRLGDSTCLHQGLLRADVDKPLQAGSTVSIDAIDTIRGETVRYTATRVYKIVEQDTIVSVNQNRVTTDGKTLPDVTISMVRVK